MIKSLLKLAIVAVVALLAYNYFFGNREEKEDSRRVFGQMRAVIVSVSQVVKSERAKFDAGKYDDALNKLGGAYRTIRQQAQHVDEKLLKRLDELERRKNAMEQELDSIEQMEQLPVTSDKKKGAVGSVEKTKKAAEQQRRKEVLQQNLDELLRDSDTLLQDAEQ
jgi:predicted  nucleic acid-binding Zn-ribbon protein